MEMNEQLAKRYPIAPLRQQQGVVLMVALVFLIIITMLGLTAMRTNIIEERLAGNSRDWAFAFQAAEAALRDAEKDIQSGTRFIGETGFDANCTNGLCKTNTLIWDDLVTSGNSGWMTGANVGPSVAYGTYTSPTPNPTLFANVARKPRYIIEVVTEKGSSLVQKGGYGNQGNQYVYRVTARGFGTSVDSSGNPIARVTIQSMYKP